MTDAEALAVVSGAFRGAPRPEHFTDYRHCEECAEHDSTLRAHTRESISVRELGNPGWDPVCFLTDEGFRYYLPALARLALATGNDSYLDQFLFHLNQSRRLKTFSLEQKDAISTFLKHLREAKFGDLEQELYSHAIDDLLRLCR